MDWVRDGMDQVAKDKGIPLADLTHEAFAGLPETPWHQGAESVKSTTVYHSILPGRYRVTRKVQIEGRSRSQGPRRWLGECKHPARR